jgi:hypothetical protein
MEGTEVHRGNFACGRENGTRIFKMIKISYDLFYQILTIIKICVLFFAASGGQCMMVLFPPLLIFVTITIDL